MYRLVHASHACDACPEDVARAVEWPKARNPGLGITGVPCLLDATCMLQYLEGEERAAP